MNTEIEELRKAVEQAHGCSASWVKAELVQDKFQRKTVWNGIVQVFELSGHPSAPKCYAWFSTDNKGARWIVTVLHDSLHNPPVSTAVDAVRWAEIEEDLQKR